MGFSIAFIDSDLVFPCPFFNYAYYIPEVFQIEEFDQDIICVGFYSFCNKFPEGFLVYVRVVGYPFFVQLVDAVQQVVYVQEEQEG